LNRTTNRGLTQSRMTHWLISVSADPANPPVTHAVQGI